MKYAIIIPYFGKWPVWFDLYLKSARENECIDFYFFTDCPLPQNIYGNIFFFKYSWDDYCNLVSDRLKITFSSKLPPYKLCDLKPFYGVIHEDILSKYDYWGYGDIDLVYGDLNRTLLKYAVGKDIVSTHGDRLSGHFCLIKNGSLNKKCFSIKRWQERLESSRHYGLDENDFSNVLFPVLRLIKAIRYRLKIKASLNKDIFWKAIKVILYSDAFLEEIPTSPRPSVGEYWIYGNRKVVDQNNQELPYIHFLFFKKTSYWLENKNYWKNGFYKVAKGINLDTATIKITNEEIVKI